MGTETDAAPLVAEIDREAEAQRQSILEEARGKAAGIATAAEARIQAAREAAHRLTEKRARVDEDRLLGQARLDAQAERQRGLRSIYQRVFARARERVSGLAASSRYAAALKALVAEALDLIPQASQLSVAASDAELCRRILRELGGSCRVEGRELPAGSVIASTADGKVQVDNSLGVRLSSAEEALETQITRCLNARCPAAAATASANAASAPNA